MGRVCAIIATPPTPRGSEYKGLTVTPMTQRRRSSRKRHATGAHRCGMTGSRSARSRATATRRSLYRSNQHDRPCNGLQYNRHRARLRAGEVQEARRRRLLQDRQPVGRTRAAPPRLQQRADRRDRNVRQGHEHPESTPHINRATLKAKGFDERPSHKIESQLLGAFEIGFVFNQLRARRGVLHRRSSA